MNNTSFFTVLTFDLTRVSLQPVEASTPYSALCTEYCWTEKDMSGVNDLNMQTDGAGGYSFDCDAILLSVVCT